MRTREKIIVLLVVATLGLGGLIFFALRDNEVEANYLRWSLANKLTSGWSSPSQFVAEELPSGTLFYGGLTIFAIVMTIIALKMVRDGEIQILRRRLLDLRSEKHEAESLLQEEVWKGKTERQAKDSVMRDLEASIEKIELLLKDLNEKEDELKTRDAELLALKAGMETSAANDSTAPVDRLLREEIKNKTELLQAKDIAIKDLEQRLSAQTRSWESELRAKEALLKERDHEVNGFRSEINDLNSRLQHLENAKKRAEERLEEEIRQKKQVLEADALASKAEGARLSERIKSLESQLSERDKLLRERDHETSTLRGRLSEAESAKAHADQELEKTLARAEKEQREKDRHLRDVEQRLQANLQALQNEVGNKDKLLEVRDEELKSLHSEAKALSLRLNEMAGEKSRAHELLQEELKKEKLEHDASKLASQRIEEQYKTEIAVLQSQLGERDVFLQRRNGEIQALKQEVQHFSEQLAEATAAREKSEKSLRAELKQERARLESSAAANREVERRYASELESLKNRLGEEETSRKNRDEEVKALNAQIGSLTVQLAKVGTAKEHAAQLLQQSSRKQKEALQANDSALREVEASFKARIDALEKQLAEKQEFVRSRDTEVATLKSELKSVTQKMVDLTAAKEQAERLFNEAVGERTDLLQAKDASARKLQEELTGKLRQLESQLRKGDELLDSRNAELAALRKQITDLSASQNNVASALQRDLQDKTALLGQKNEALEALEERLTARILSLENDLGKKQELLEGREIEIKTLLGKLNHQSGKLAELEASGDRAKALLEDELRRSTEVLESKDAALKALDDRVSGKLQFLESQLSQKQELLATRDSELDALMSKVNELTQKLSEASAERERAERLHQEELRETTALLQSKDSSLGELEVGFKERIVSLERQLTEKQRLLEGSGSELGELRAQMNELADRLDDAETARAELEALLQKERGRADKALLVVKSGDQESERVNGEGRGVETLLSEREELLKTRDKLIQNLMNELKEKKTQLARHEIEVWKGIERREAWKHRLAKVGIRLKD
jgi:chromosome segregation ATPase